MRESLFFFNRIALYLNKWGGVNQRIRCRKYWGWMSQKVYWELELVTVHCVLDLCWVRPEWFLPQWENLFYYAFIPYNTLLYIHFGYMHSNLSFIMEEAKHFSIGPFIMTSLIWNIQNKPIHKQKADLPRVVTGTDNRKVMLNWYRLILVLMGKIQN